MIRRLFKLGRGIVLSLPREALDRLNLTAGQDVFLEIDPEHRRLIVTPVEKSISIPGVSEEFARQVDEFIKLYRPALEKLAK